MIRPETTWHWSLLVKSQWSDIHYIARDKWPDSRPKIFPTKKAATLAARKFNKKFDRPEVVRIKMIVNSKGNAMTDKCNVVVFCDNTSHDYIERNLSPRLAVEQARVIINRNHPAINKVIITDSGDCTTFQWERGSGGVR